jgi:hypothetical protein
MNPKNLTTNWNKPAVFTAQTYDTKISVEIDHSDLDLDEVITVFETLIIGMGYSKDSFEKWVIQKAEELKEDKWIPEHPHSNEDVFDDYGMRTHNND